MRRKSGIMGSTRRSVTLCVVMIARQPRSRKRPSTLKTLSQLYFTTEEYRKALLDAGKSKRKKDAS